MKTLYLLRHAKSGWATPDVRDFDRPLNERGVDDAAEMGARLKERVAGVDLVVSSPALRALTTATIVSEILGIAPEAIQQDRQIYLAGSPRLLQIISLFTDHAQSALLVAHNPALTDLANDLAHAAIDNIPTSGLVTIELAIEHWHEVQFGQARMTSFEFPHNPD